MKITSSGELEVSPGTEDMSGPWGHSHHRWCGSLGTWRSGAWLFPGRLGTWGLLPSFQWPPWETWSSCCTFPGILGKWSLLPSFRWIRLKTWPPCWYTNVSSKPNFSILTTSCSGFRNLVAPAFQLRKKDFQYIACVRSKSMVRPSTAFPRKLLKYLQSLQILHPTFCLAPHVL